MTTFMLVVPTLFVSVDIASRDTPNPSLGYNTLADCSRPSEARTMFYTTVASLRILICAGNGWDWKSSITRKLLVRGRVATWLPRAPQSQGYISEFRSFRFMARGDRMIVVVVVVLAGDRVLAARWAF